MTSLLLSLLAVGAYPCAADDSVLLLQTTHNNDDEDSKLIAGVDEANSTFVSTAANKMYRLKIFETYGSDHVCLTELSFMDGNSKILDARPTHMSSCYGCPVSCDGCEANYGKPSAAFDRVTDTDSFTAWSCTAAGTFPGGKGEQTIQFTLKERPAKGTIWTATTDGAWAAKKFNLQEQQTDGTWRTIGQSAAQGQGLEESFFVQTIGSMEDPPKWPVNDETCALNDVTDVVDVTPDASPFAVQATFSALSARSLAPNSLYGCKNGVSIDGNFGTISLPSGAYETRQLVLNFPSKRRLNGDLAEGELQIILQKVGSPGLFDTAVVVIILQLPEEGAAASPTEQFFIDLGLEDLPAKGSSKTLSKPIDLSVFQTQFEGGLSTLDCSSSVPWYVLTSPALVSGSVVASMGSGPSAAAVETKTFEGFTGPYTSFVTEYGEEAAVTNWAGAEVIIDAEPVVADGANSSDAPAVA